MTARLQQKLDHLQDLLIDAEFSHNVVVFYQLRGLGYQCESKLTKFAEQLKQQREQKRHHTLLSDWHEGLREESKQVELELLEIRDLNYQLEDQLQSEQRRLTTMNAFTRLFRSRSAMKLVDSIATQIETTGHEEIAIRNRLSEIKDRQPPDNQGLDIAAKRSINLMILSFAQQLYLHFDDTGIVGLVKEATQKSVGSINYVHATSVIRCWIKLTMTWMPWSTVLNLLMPCRNGPRCYVSERSFRIRQTVSRLRDRFRH